MAICGINVNMSSLQGQLTTTVSGFLNLKGTLGKPGGIAALSGVLGGGLSAIKSKVTSMIPEIPFSTSGFSSLRNDLQSVVSGAGSGLTGFLSKYAGLTGLSGYANLNLNDLAKSAISLSASFDPCSIDIPNVLSDASGKLEKLAPSAPSIGQTIQAGKNILEDQSFTDSIATATNDITTLVSTMSSTEAQTALTKNIQQAKTFSDGCIQRRFTGEDYVMTQEELRSLIAEESANMIDEETQSYSI